MCTPHLANIFPCGLSPHTWLYSCAEIIRAPSLMMSSRMSSNPRSLQTPFLLIVTGELALRSQILKAGVTHSCGSDWVKLYLGKKNGTHVLGCTCADFWVLMDISEAQRIVDNEFTQLMKGLQGERLRQSFKFFDQDEDGFIRPDQFKRIIMVCRSSSVPRNSWFKVRFHRKLQATNYPKL